MKISEDIKNKKKRQSGSALLLVLLITLVLGWTLASYLNLVSNERTLAARSQDWNAAIPVAEAGIEEALTQLTYAGTNNLTTNGWTLGGDGMYHHTPRSLTASSFYGTAIQPATQPIIWSTGFVASPFNGTSHSVKRLVRVVATQASSFGYGILAKGTIKLSGNGLIDSFNGANGLYNPATATANVIALTDLAAAGAIDLTGGATINGNAVTGPGGTVTTSGGSSVAGTINNNANVQINDPGLPAWTTNSALYSINISSGAVSGTNYSFVATNGNYMVSSLNVGNNSMAVSGNVVIYCTSTGNNVVNLSGQGYIYITPGSSLTIYTAGNVSCTGQGVINGSQNAADCYIYGLPTCAKIDYSGSANFIGVIDAPEADLKFTGGESASGAFTANTADLSGKGGVHYDTSLGGSGPGYVVQSWNEMPVH